MKGFPIAFFFFLIGVCYGVVLELATTLHTLPIFIKHVSISEIRHRWQEITLRDQFNQGGLTIHVRTPHAVDLRHKHHINLDDRYNPIVGPYIGSICHVNALE